MLFQPNEAKMETTFYDEQNYNLLHSRNHLKRELTLDFSEHSSKMTKFHSNNVVAPPVLSSPDLNMLKLGSPELERLIIDQQNGLAHGQPNNQLMFPRSVTEEQEIYAQGFVEALNELHHSDSSQCGMIQNEVFHVNSVTGAVYQNLDYPQPNCQYLDPTASCMVKEEPQTVPNSQPISPLNAETQEMIKLERKRYRNRLAASKCRKRKLERIALLENKVEALKGDNTELTIMATSLKEEVCLLKDKILRHVQQGCRISFSHQ